MFEANEKKIALVTDTSCDLNQEDIEKYDIRCISLRVVCSQGEFRDRVEINSDKLYDILKQEIPKSSLPLPEDVTGLYESLIAEGCTDVLHISMSSGLSGTYNMVRMVAAEFEGRLNIHVVDSLSLSMGLGQLVLDAGRVLAENGSIEDAIALVNSTRKTQLGCFVIRTLEFLRKGGRIGLVEGVVGTILQLKPIIFVNPDGVYQTLTKARGFSNAVNAMVNEITSRYGQKKLRLSVVNGAAEDDAMMLMERFKSVLNVVEWHVCQVSPVLAIHTGPGLLGVIAEEA